jgi:hypothetical protein
MTSEEAIKELRDASDSEVRYGDKDNHYDKVMKRVEAFDMAIKALEQEPCEDAISREELLKKCVHAPIAPVIKGDGVHYEDVVFAKDIINAKPLYPKAKWIPVNENGDEDNGEI